MTIFPTRWTPSPESIPAESAVRHWAGKHRAGQLSTAEHRAAKLCTAKLSTAKLWAGKRGSDKHGATRLVTMSAMACFVAACQISSRSSEATTDSLSCSDIAAASQAPARAPTPTPHDEAPKASGATKGYTPGVGEFMTSIQQHHAKLWFAGEAANWRLVDYELAEIEEQWKAVQEFHPVVEGNAQPIERSIAMFTSAPRAALHAAVAGKDTAGFREGFDALTASCNTCHQTYGKDFVRIVRPAKHPVTNQDFAPH